MVYYPSYQCRHVVNSPSELVRVRNVDIGDLASIQETGLTYECIALPSSNLSNWRVYGSGGGGGGGGPVDWADVTNKPTTFPPSAHTHDWDEITDKPTAFAPAAHTHGSSEINNQSTLPGATVTAVLNGLSTAFVEVADVGVTVAPLESTLGGPKIPPQYIQLSAFEQNVVVADQAARLALTGTLSTIAFQESDDTAWIIAAGAVKSNAANWSSVNTAVTGVSAFNGRAGVVTPQAGDYSAGQIAATPVGTLSSTSVQGQLNELEAEKLGAGNLSAAAPAALGTAAPGTSANISRADHVHAHGNQGGGTLHDTATPSAAGFMSAADKAKLDGIAPGGSGIPTLRVESTSGLTLTNSAGAALSTGVDHTTARRVQTHSGNTEIRNSFALPVNDAANAIVMCEGGSLNVPYKKVVLPAFLRTFDVKSAAAGADIVWTSSDTGFPQSYGKTTVDQLFTGRLLTSPRIQGATETKQAQNSVTGAVAMPAFTGHNTYHYRLTGNTTLTLPSAAGVVSGACVSITIIIDQDATGNRTLALTAPAGDTIIPTAGQGTPGVTVSGIAIAMGASKRTRIVLSRNQGENRWDMAIVYTEA